MTKYMSMYGAPSDEDWYGEPECEECDSRKVRWNIDGFFCVDHWTEESPKEEEKKIKKEVDETIRIIEEDSDGEEG